MRLPELVTAIASIAGLVGIFAIMASCEVKTEHEVTERQKVVATNSVLAHPNPFLHP